MLARRVEEAAEDAERAAPPVQAPKAPEGPAPALRPRPRRPTAAWATS